MNETIFRQYEKVRKSGAVNMVDVNMVKNIARHHACDELVNYINQGKYYDILENYEMYEEKYE